ncbi:MAG: hypothetical protein JJU10_02020 [Idiomarina sp.]|nr:hypothetical protein [Idiomarina sp.]
MPNMKLTELQFVVMLVSADTTSLGDIAAYIQKESHQVFVDHPELNEGEIMPDDLGSDNYVKVPKLQELLDEKALLQAFAERHLSKQQQTELFDTLSLENNKRLANEYLCKIQKLSAWRTLREHAELKVLTNWATANGIALEDSLE